MPCKQQANISCKILPTVSPTQVFTEEIGLLKKYFYYNRSRIFCPSTMVTVDPTLGGMIK